MNAKRRKELEKALTLLGDALDIINQVREDEEDAYENMPEGLQESERGEQMSDNVYELEMAANDIENVADSINEIIDA